MGQHSGRARPGDLMALVHHEPSSLVRACPFRVPGGEHGGRRANLCQPHIRTARVLISIRASRHSHSMVAGGLLVMSSTTRLISGTSLVIRVEIAASTESGSRAQSAVIASSLVTGRSTTG